MRNTFCISALLAITLLITGACGTPAENMATPTGSPTVEKPAPRQGIGISWDEIQMPLREDPFGFAFNLPYELMDGRSMVLGYSLEEEQEGMIELVGPPSNLTEIILTTPITGEYARIGLSRLSEVVFHVMPERERRQGVDAWVGDHVLLAVEEGAQSARYNDICMEMEWFENLQMMTLGIERCAP